MKTSLESDSVNVSFVNGKKTLALFYKTNNNNINYKFVGQIRCLIITGNQITLTVHHRNLSIFNSIQFNPSINIHFEAIICPRTIQCFNCLSSSFFTEIEMNLRVWVLVY